MNSGLGKLMPPWCGLGDVRTVRGHAVIETRRNFLKSVAIMTAAPSFLSTVASAQSKGRVPLVGVLWLSPEARAKANPYYQWIHEDLTTLGYSIGRTLIVENRFAPGGPEDAEKCAKELVSLSPDVLVAVTWPGTVALKKATARIPIIFLGISDPVGDGLVKSLARPGGNVTGITSTPAEVYRKRVSLLKAVVPSMSHLALILNDDKTSQSEFEIKQYKLGAADNNMELVLFDTRYADGLEQAFSKIARSKCTAVVLANQGPWALFRDEMATLSLQYRLPAMAPNSLFVPAGVLMAYTSEVRDQYRIVAGYVKRVLDGESPADLPVHVPTKFELLFNTKTANALGLTLPRTCLRK